jgi:hypothetical protein
MQTSATTARNFLRNQARHVERRSRELVKKGRIELATKLLTRAENLAAASLGDDRCLAGLAWLGVEVRP